MDQDVIELARQLQLRLQQLDARTNRATLEWVHGLLITMIGQIEKSIPALALKQQRSSESDWDELERMARSVQPKLDRLDNPDSLEQIVKELEGPDDPAGVPATTRALSADWQRMYGHPMYFAETFIDPGRFRGTCYRAANWQLLGATTGRGKNDHTNKPNRPIKEVLGFPLTRHSREYLSHA